MHFSRALLPCTSPVHFPRAGGGRRRQAGQACSLRLAAYFIFLMAQELVAAAACLHESDVWVIMLIVAEWQAAAATPKST